MCPGPIEIPLIHLGLSWLPLTITQLPFLIWPLCPLIPIQKLLHALITFMNRWKRRNRRQRRSWRYMWTTNIHWGWSVWTLVPFGVSLHAPSSSLSLRGVLQPFMPAPFNLLLPSPPTSDHEVEENTMTMFTMLATMLSTLFQTLIFSFKLKILFS